MSTKHCNKKGFFIISIKLWTLQNFYVPLKKTTTRDTFTNSSNANNRLKATMSYQIKSTPYFRRMFNNSKKNGQLQRLREEYERIQEFNDRTIELKMRQVRLKRLFREIEELKEGGSGHGSGNAANAANRASAGGGGGGSPSPTLASHSTRRRHHQSHGHHHHHYHQNLLSAGITPEQRRHHQRAEALIRSRELGKELSRRNAQMAEAGVGGYLRPDLRTSAKMRAVADFRRDAEERRERAAKRISYGNDQSRQNLQRQLRVCQRRLTAKYRPHQTQELGPNEFHPDYRHVTPSQLDMMVDEEEMAEEQQRYFREQEEDELLLAEERFRRQEKCLRLEVAGSSITSEEEDGQEELRFLRGEQALSEPEDEEDDVHHEKVMELRRRQNLKRQAQEHFLGDSKYNLTLAEEHFRLVTGYSDEDRQEDQEEDEDEDEDANLQQMDEKEAGEQWDRRLREKTSLLPLRRFSLSSTAIDAAPSAVNHNHYHPVSVAGAFSSDQDMRTAPLAHEELMTSMVPPRSVKCRTVSETDDVPALNNWRRVSLMMPWFKVLSPSKSLSDRSLDRTLQELPMREGETAELLEPSMIEESI